MSPQCRRNGLPDSLQYVRVAGLACRTRRCSAIGGRRIGPGVLRVGMRLTAAMGGAETAESSMDLNSGSWRIVLELWHFLRDFQLPSSHTCTPEQSHEDLT